MSNVPPSQPPAHQLGTEEVNTTVPLVLSIVVTLLCCLPLGVVGIVFSAMAMSDKGNGNFAAAKDKAKKAMIFNYIGLAVGVLFILAYIALFVLGAVGAAAAGSAQP